MTQTFSLTPKQLEAQAVCAGDASNVMLFGGSRSGKTFLLTRNVVMRALKAADSRHAAFRFRFNAIKSSIVLDTFPKVMKLAFPQVDYQLDKSDWYATFPNGSQFWFGGLDDKERTEKILGMEFATIYLNECSQIPWASVGMAQTRLAQKAEQNISGHTAPLKPRMFYDCNPPVKTHWTYRLFVEKVDPESRLPLTTPERYACFRINPADNASNLSAEYLDTLKSLPARLQKRFLLGEFGDANPSALFPDDVIETYRVTDGKVPDMVRVVVGIDPSGSGDEDNADNDEIGIVVGGIGTDGNAYLLEDCTVKAGPATWGAVAVSAFDRHQADLIVGEKNYGGEMVAHVIKTQRSRAPFKFVTATRGKIVRAEPFGALYAQGKVRHVGLFPQLEDELAGFGTNGFTGSRSPNRADAWIWVLNQLFPGLTRREDVQESRLRAGHSLAQSDYPMFG